MAYILIMPRQGNTVESCILGEWKVKEGDTVEADTPVCVVETDKAAFEIPAGAPGTVLKILHQTGDDVPVLQPILVVGNPGEAWEADIAGGGTPAPDGPMADTAAARSTPDAAPQIAAGNVPAGAIPASALPGTEGERPAASPRAKNLAEKEAVDLRTLTGTGPGGRITEKDVAAAIALRPPLTAAAKDELRRIIASGGAAPGGPGSGIGGRLTLADISAGGTASPQQGSSAVSTATAGEYTDSPIKGIRKIISDQMMSSHTNTAAFTLNASAPVVTLQALRARFKAGAPELGLDKITINDLVLFAASRLLPRYPFMNAHKIGNSLRSFTPVHLGVAVSTPRGLMVPVLRNADRLSLQDIAAKARALAEACRGGTISPDDLHGSTFTVTNLGNTGIESFTPVINVPEVAILGVCGIQPKAAETAPGQYGIIPHLGFSLTIDHAVVDGAPAAEFLKAFCGAIRDIDLWLAK
jgi:pyruvate dehydrogenase E2 component (dihydrolipoamide acetyltransferase)